MFIDTGRKKETSIVDYPDSSINEMSVRVNGLTMATRSTSNIELLYFYNGLGRQTGLVDPRLGSSQTHYNALGQVDYVQDPAGNTTSFGYDPDTGRKVSETNATGKTTRFEYDDLGRLVHTWGDVPYPVEYVYDQYGQMTEMHTFRDGPDRNGGT
ncbi:hypothetical protein JXQ70_03260 [bacterium]|nr:hypothetical protein [bacterium]